MPPLAAAVSYSLSFYLLPEAIRSCGFLSVNECFVFVQHGGVAVPFGMASPGVATTTDDARFCMPWAAAHFDNWGDSGIVVTSPLAETASTDFDDVSGGNHHAQKMMVCSARL